MPTLNVAVTDSGLTSFGLKTGATAFNTGTRVNTAGNPTQMDIAFTGANAVTIPNPYMAAGALTAYLYATDGVTVLAGPVSPSPAVANSLSNTDLLVFTGLTEATTYWLRLKWTGNGNQIMQSDKVIALTGTGTPVTSLPGNYTRNMYNFSQANYDGGDLLSHAGFEGGSRVQFIGSNYGVTMNNTNAYTSYAMIRFKATIGRLFVAQYHGSSNLHLRRLPADGSSGVGTKIGTYTVNGAGSIAGWDEIFTGLDTTTEYIYELSFSATSGGGVIIPYVMTQGGTGINLTPTAASLVRPIIAVGLGDSRMSAVTGTANHSDEGSLALLGQQKNKQVVNFGWPARSLSQIITDNTYLAVLALPSIPQNIIIDGGINDIKGGGAPTPATVSGYMIQIINQLRSNAGYGTVPIYVDSVKPYSGMTFAALDAFNNGVNGFRTAVVAAFNTGTAAGQTGGADANVKYANEDTMALAGTIWAGGGAFSNTPNFDNDGLHLNSASSTGLVGTGEATQGTFYVNLLAPAVPATTYTLTGPSSGVVSVASTNFTITPNGTTTNTVTVSDGGAGGTFSPTMPVTLNGTTPVTFTYTPATTGAKTLTPANNSGGSISNPAALTYTATNPPATGYTFTGPTGGLTNGASTAFTVALSPSGGTNAGVTITPATTGSGTFSPTSVTLNTGTPSQTFTYTPTTSTTATISTANTGGFSNPATISYTSSSAPATGISLAGPSSGVISVPTTAYTVALTPGGGASAGVTVTPASTLAGTFSPPTVSLSTGTPSQTFTFTPSASGSGQIRASVTGGLTPPGNLTLVVVNPNSRTPVPPGVRTPVTR
jgi:hypothetical protein